MDNQIIETFLAQQNLQHNYKFVTNEVKKKINVNIDRYPGMDRQFQKMALAISNSKKGNNPNLSELNSDLVNHSTNYFCKKITDIKKKKQEQKIQNSGQHNGQHNGQYNNIANSYNELIEQNKKNNEHPDMDNNMFQHGNMVNTINNLTDVNNNNYNNSLTNEMGNNQGQFNYSQHQQGQGQGQGQGQDHQQGQVVNQEPNILPFNINEDISNMLSSSQIGEDLPLYQNIVDLTDNSTDLMKKVEQLDNERSSGLFSSASSDNSLNYNNINQKKQNDVLRQNLYTNTNNINSNFNNRGGNNNKSNSSDNIMQERNSADLVTYNQNSEIKDPTELYRINEESKKKMIDRMTNSSISNNDLRTKSTVEDNLILEKILSLQRNSQPDYMDVVNYVIINSIDRDWYNNNNKNNTRYNFKVVFRQDSLDKSAGIQKIFKNITSIEIVNAILPQDNVLIPFDARVYLDILHFPYLLLQIPEFGNVFNGTNNNNDKAFSVLIFDKQHDSSVLSTDFISGATDSIVNGTPKNQFYKEYRKTFYKFTPAYFERKDFYNQPLASLGYMTIQLATPAGENINILDDVLTISDIKFTAKLNTLEATEANNFEYKVSHGFPREDMSSHSYIRIETTSAFSNKLFKLGDNIKIQGYDITGSGAKNNDFVNFINRDEGHYILNTDLTDLSNVSTSNQGFVSNLYIAPPGNLNGTLTGLETNSYYDDNRGSDIDIDNYSNNDKIAKLINSNLQTHFLFKINTRQPNVSKLTLPVNV